MPSVYTSQGEVLKDFYNNRVTGLKTNEEGDGNGSNCLVGYRVSLWVERMFGRGLLVALNCCCSVAQSCLTLCNPTDCSTLCLPVLHHLRKFGQTHVH